LALILSLDIYAIFDRELVVLIVKLGHRREVYR